MRDCCDPTSPSPDPVVQRLEREVDRLNFDLCQCRLELTTAREISHQLGTERDEWKAACQEKFKVNVDSPLFSGLVGGSFDPGVLLASLHAVTAERDAAIIDNARLRGLLREACIGYEHNYDDASSDKRLRRVPIFHAWYEAAQAALEGKP